MSKPTKNLIRATQVAVLMVVGCVFAGCGAVPYSAPVVPPPGGLYTQIKAPLTTNVNGNAATTNLKKHSSKQTQFVHIPYISLEFGWGEADIASIARQGGIKEVVYADYELMSILGIYAEFTVHVYGN